MQRLTSAVTSEAHPFYGPFMNSMSNAIFEWSAEDVGRLCEAKRSELEVVGVVSVQTITESTTNFSFGTGTLINSVISGVPQGIVLGPVFFLIMMSDISQILKTNIVCFADDIRLFNLIDSQNDCSLLQSDLEKI